MDKQKLANINVIKRNAALTSPNHRLFAQHIDVGVGKLLVCSPVYIKYGCEIDLTGNITIGKHSELAKYVQIFTHRHCWKHSRGLRKDIQRIEAVDLVMGEDVFIGNNTIIITVENIGDGAIIGAGSVLTKNVPSYEVWAGNPAIKIGERDK